MVVALLGINIGVMAVATALANAEVSRGRLGLGGCCRSSDPLRGATSPRWSSTSLRSPWGSSASPSSRPGTPGLDDRIARGPFIGDHPALFRGFEQHRMTLDEVYTDRAAPRPDRAPNSAVRSRIEIKKVDQVRGTTTVDVRYRRG